MGSGNNYSGIHEAALLEFKRYHRRLFRSMDRVSWTSNPTPWDGIPQEVYNCFGHALDWRKWLEPNIKPGDDEGDPRYDWPEKIQPRPENQRISTYISAARFCGFEGCGFNAAWEHDFEKIVLLHDKREHFTHAALQVAPTVWKSKVGEHSDIEHPLKIIFGGEYGKGCVFMKRKRVPRQLN